MLPKTFSVSYIFKENFSYKEKEKKSHKGKECKRNKQKMKSVKKI